MSLLELKHTIQGGENHLDTIDPSIASNFEVLAKACTMGNRVGNVDPSRFQCQLMKLRPLAISMFHGTPGISVPDSWVASVDRVEAARMDFGSIDELKVVVEQLVAFNPQTSAIEQSFHSRPEGHQ